MKETFDAESKKALIEYRIERAYERVKADVFYCTTFEIITN